MILWWWCFCFRNCKFFQFMKLFVIVNQFIDFWSSNRVRTFASINTISLFIIILEKKKTQEPRRTCGYINLMLIHLKRCCDCLWYSFLRCFCVLFDTIECCSKRFAIEEAGPPTTAVPEVWRRYWWLVWSPGHCWPHAEIESFAFGFARCSRSAPEHSRRVS